MRSWYFDHSKEQIEIKMFSHLEMGEEKILPSNLIQRIACLFVALNMVSLLSKRLRAHVSVSNLTCFIIDKTLDMSMVS